MYFILGISVSIDALVVGFTALNGSLDAARLLQDTGIIGLVTLILSLMAFYLGRYAKRITIVAKYADYIGGAILILFGMKMMFL